MSQKENKFQSKSKNFGGKGKSGFGGGARGGAGGGKKPPGRSFGKKFEGDRGADRGDRPPRREGEYKARRPREDGERAAPRRDFGDRPPRREYTDRPPRRDGGDFKPRRPREDGERAPRRDFGDRPPRREYTDRPPRRDGGDFKPRRPREDGERAPRRDFGDRPPRREYTDHPPRRDDGDFKPRRPREDGERTTRGDFGDRKPRRDGDFKPRRDEAERKPRRNFQDRGPSAKRYGEKPGERKFGDRKSAPRRSAAYETREPYEASEETNRKLKSERTSFGAPSPLFLYGHHAVRAALTNPARKIKRIVATESGFENIREAYDEAAAAGIARPQPLIAEKEDLDRLLPRDAVHQDVMVDVEQLEDTYLQDLLISAGDTEDIKVVVLDQVTDPHNVGAILRTASAFGAQAVIVQKLHAPDITGTLAKSASGAVEHVPLLREVNLSRALEQLKDAGFTCIGLDERGKVTIAQAAVKGRVALVMGAEGDGLRRLVGEKCDVLAQLPTDGPIASLNVSNALAVALYEIVRR